MIAILPKVAVVAISVALIGGWASAQDTQPAKDKFIVHEWGVQVRCQTLSGPALQSLGQAKGLPAFVVQNAQRRTRETFGWDKPVLHFYGPAQKEVSVTVQTPKGYPTVWYPAAQQLRHKYQEVSRTQQMVWNVQELCGLKWTGKLEEKPTNKLAAVPDGSWWNGVRDVPGLYFTAGNVSERFLFYEALAFQEPMVTATINDKFLHLCNSHTAGTGKVLVLVSVDGKRYVRVLDKVPSDLVAGLDTATVLRKDNFLQNPMDDKQLLEACRELWQSYGMTKEESAAIVDSWKEQLLAPYAVLVISRMPTEVYDKMFPLEITPKPDAIVRAGVVFDYLPGQNTRLGWLDGIDKEIEKLAADLGSDTAATRESAARKLESMGDLPRAALEKLAKGDNIEAREQAKALLKLIEPVQEKSPTTAPSVMVDNKAK